jgi:2-C-methyl-D-erythritol 4-phosphate cytidylyltransferase
LAVALILAAGRGERLGATRPKALVELAGRPLLQWSLDALRGVGAIERIVVALPPGVDEEQVALGVGSGAAAGVDIDAGVDVDAGKVIVAEGGAVRSESVRLALAVVDGEDSDLVLVHDAARPLLSAALIEDTLAAASRDGVDGAIAAAPVTDTVKRAGADRVVTETLERSSLWAVQTPQVFRRGALERALDVPDDVLAQATDDAWLIERAGGIVVVVPAPRENLKVTTPLDLALAEMLIAQRAGQPAAPPA